MRALLVLLALALSAPVFGQTTHTWVGGSGSWFASSSWSPQGIPGAGDTALITTGSPVIGRDTTVARIEFGGASLDGDGNLTVTNEMIWSDGRLNGRDFAPTAALTIASGATLRITGDTEKGLRSRDLFNEGTVIWEDSGDLVVQFTTVFENRTGATFDIHGDARMTRTNGTLTLRNDGLIVKSAGGGTTSIEYPFGSLINNGTIRSEAGTLRLANGSGSFTTSGDGDFEIAPEATLRFDTASYSYGLGSTVSGAGTLLVSSGTATLGRAAMTGLTRINGGTLKLMGTDAPSEFAAVEVSGGALGGVAEANINGMLTWTGGALGISPHSGGVLNLLGGVEATGAASKRFASGTYANAGLFRWMEGPFEVRNGGTFRNLAGATFSIESDDSWTRGNGFITVVNEGMLVKTGTAGQTLISLPFAPFNNDGEVRVESGTLHLDITFNSTDTGRYRVQEGATLRFSGSQRTLTADAVVEGTGTLGIGGPLVFGGTLRPGASPGVLSVDGDLPALQSGGVLEVEIGGAAPGTDFDQLAVSGSAALGGTLRVRLTDGFTPAEGDRFLIVPASGGASGAFDALNLPDGLEAFVVASGVGAELVIGTPVAGEDAPLAPEALALSAPVPNPSSENVALHFALPDAGVVRLALVDALGREVAVLASGEHAAGAHTARLDARFVAPGTYIVRLTTASGVATQRMAVVR